MAIDYKKFTKDKKTLTLWVLTVLLVLFAVSFSFFKNDTNTKQSDKQRAASITKQLRCLECEGLSVYDSDTPISTAIKDEVKDKVKKGESNDKIIGSFVKTYGEFIRLNPTSNDGNWAVYVFPIVALIFITLAIFVYTRKNNKFVIPKTNLKISNRILFWTSFALAICVLTLMYKIDISNVENVATPEKESVTTTSQKSKNLEESYKKQLEADPSAVNYRALGILQFARENYVDALKNLDKASALDSQDASSRAYASFIIFSAGKYENAKNRVNEAIKINPESVEALFFQGLIYRQIPTISDVQKTENINTANRNFDKILQLDPDGIFAQQINQIRG